MNQKTLNTLIRICVNLLVPFVLIPTLLHILDWRCWICLYSFFQIIYCLPNYLCRYDDDITIMIIIGLLIYWTDMGFADGTSYCIVIADLLLHTICIRSTERYLTVAVRCSLLNNNDNN